MIDANLLISDIGAVERLVRDRPDPSLRPELVGEYHFNTGDPAAKQWCCHCQSHRHQKGFIAEDETGNRYSLGSKCGPEHYGLAFAIAKNEFRTVRSRQHLLLRLQAVAAVAPQVIAECNALLVPADLKRLEDKRAQLERRCHSEIVELRRDYPGNLRGWALIGDGAGVHRSISALRGVVERLAAIWERGGHERDAKKVQDLLRSFATGIDAAAEQLRIVGQAHTFFDPDHLERLARWSEDRGRNLATDGQRLIVKREGQPDVAIHWLAPVVLPSLALELLRKAQMAG